MKVFQVQIGISRKSIGNLKNLVFHATLTHYINVYSLSHVRVRTTYEIQTCNTELIFLQTPGVERQRSASQSSTGSGGQPANSGAPRMGRRMSMEEYDQPNLRRLSLTGAAAE